MIRLKKIKSLKERVQIRKCGEVFHLVSKGAVCEESDEIFSYLLTLLNDDDRAKAVYYHSKGRFDDIYYLTLGVLGESPADWDMMDDDGLIDFSCRTVFHHSLYLDSIRSPFNVGSMMRSVTFCMNVSSAKLTGETAPIPPVFRPVSPSPIRL